MYMCSVDKRSFYMCFLLTLYLQKLWRLRSYVVFIMVVAVCFESSTMPKKERVVKNREKTNQSEGYFNANTESGSRSARVLEAGGIEREPRRSIPGLSVGFQQGDGSF